MTQIKNPIDLLAAGLKKIKYNGGIGTLSSIAEEKETTPYELRRECLKRLVSGSLYYKKTEKKYKNIILFESPEQNVPLLHWQEVEPFLTTLEINICSSAQNITLKELTRKIKGTKNSIYQSLYQLKKAGLIKIANNKYTALGNDIKIIEKTDGDNGEH